VNGTGFDITKPGCNGNKKFCWCTTDDCNAADKMEAFRKAYTPPPNMCWSGAAGQITDPTDEEEKCEKTQLRKDKEPKGYEGPSCSSATLSNMCVENNKHSGQGDGCRTPPGETGDKRRGEDTCESYTPEGREPRKPDESFNGKTTHCRWIPAKTKQEKAETCGKVAGCEFKADEGTTTGSGCSGTVNASYPGGDRRTCDVRSGEADCLSKSVGVETGCTWNAGEQEGNCKENEASMDLRKASDAKEQAWKKESGKDCYRRLKTGCFENNDHMGENEQCTGNQDEESCVTESGGDFCQHASNGVCSGDSGCEDRDGSHECEKEKHQGEHHDSGPFCEMNDVYREHEFQHAGCSGRTLSNMCVENNMHVGQGDGCGDMEEVDGTWVKKFTDENSCTSYRAGDRNADDSFDGTNNHCRWIPPKDKEERAQVCEADNECMFYNDRGEYVNNVQQGNCEQSDSANEKETAWRLESGMRCEARKNTVRVANPPGGISLTR